MDGMETPRRDANDFDMPSFASPMPSLLSPIPSSPVPYKSKSPRYTSFSSITKQNRNDSPKLLENERRVLKQSTPLKLTLSRRASECGRRDKWNIDKSNSEDDADNLGNDSFNSTKISSSKEPKHRHKDVKSDSAEIQNLSLCDSNHHSAGDSKSYAKKSRGKKLSNAKKIDKIVLNLKKTAGAGDWTSTSKVLNSVEKASDTTSKSKLRDDYTVSNENTDHDSSNALPKQKRVGRKSITTPKKLVLKVKPVVVNASLSEDKSQSYVQTNKDKSDNAIRSNVNHSTTRISTGQKNVETQKLIFLKPNNLAANKSNCKEISTQNISSTATVKAPDNFKKPFILKKIDPAQLCNKELVRIDPSQIQAIFNKQKTTNLKKKESNIATNETFPKSNGNIVIKSSNASENSISEVSKSTNEKLFDDTCDSKSSNSSTHLIKSEANKENASKKICSDKKKDAKILPSLSNRLSMQYGVECTVSVKLPPGSYRSNPVGSLDHKKAFNNIHINKNTSSFNVKEMIDLSNKYIKSADEEFPEFSKLMKDFDSYNKKSKQSDNQQASLDLAIKIQDSLKIPNSSKINSFEPIKRSAQFGSGTNFENGLVFSIYNRHKTIDLPTENEAFAVSESMFVDPGIGGFKISLTSDSDGIEGELLKRPPSPSEAMHNGAFLPHLKKRGRPKKEQSKDNIPKPSRLNINSISRPGDIDLKSSKFVQKESEQISNHVPTALSHPAVMNNELFSDGNSNVNENVQPTTQPIVNEPPSSNSYSQQQEFTNNLPINPPCVIQVNNVGYRTINGWEGDNFSNNGINDSTQIAATPVDPFEEFVRDQRSVNYFLSHLRVLMEGFCFPSELEGKVDPMFYMLLCRKNDPRFSHFINDSMIILYKKIADHELRKQQLIQQQMRYHIEEQQRDFTREQVPTSAQISNIDRGSQLSPQAVNGEEITRQHGVQLNAKTDQTSISTSTRTYTELQPVENISKCNDGKEVLRLHQEGSKAYVSNYRNDEISCNSSTKVEHANNTNNSIEKGGTFVSQNLASV